MTKKSKDDEGIVMRPPAWVTDGLDDTYKMELHLIQEQIMKEGVQKVANSQYENCMLSDEWLYDLPHPVRKRWAGYLPIHMELMLQEEKEVAMVMTALSKPEIEISTFVKKLVDVSPSLKEMLVKSMNDASSSNFGALDPTVFPHCFYAKGSHHYKLTEERATFCREIELGNNHPSGFLQPPRGLIYIEAKTGLTINNVVSGDHELEGFYVNQYTLPASRVKEEWDADFNQPGSGTMNAYMRQRGHITKDGGDIRVLEFLATGRPKENMVDDATFNFSIIIQDELRPLKEVIDAHADFYSQYKDHKSIRPFAQGIKFKNAGERERTAMHTITNYIAKTLVHITDPATDIEMVLNYTNAMRKVKTAQSGAMKRKAIRLARRSYDYKLVK